MSDRSFRILNTKTNEIEDKEFVVLENGDVCYLHRGKIKPIDVDGSNYKFIRSTGFFDANGIELFDGDCVTTTSNKDIGLGRIMYVSDVHSFAYVDFENKKTFLIYNDTAKKLEYFDDVTFWGDKLNNDPTMDIVMKVVSFNEYVDFIEELAKTRAEAKEETEEQDA